jgi:hypothetical protein
MKTKKTLEEMTDRELMAHTMAVKRAYSKKLNSFTSTEEMMAWVNAGVRQAEAEWGIKFKYADPPSVRTIQ